MLDLLGSAYSQDLHSKPKCALESLAMGEMYLRLDDHDPAIIAIGMLMIFPSLVRFNTRSPIWAKVGLMVRALGQVREMLAVITEGLMKVLSQVREQAENGVPTSSVEEIARIFCEPLSLAGIVD